MVNKACSTADAVAALLGAADPEGILSCRDAIQKIRLMVDKCELTDNELVDLVALVAVRRNMRAISFDVNDQVRELRSVA